MKPHPKIHKTIKWGGAGAAALLGTAVLWSATHLLTYSPAPGREWRFATGAIALEELNLPPNTNVSQVPVGWAVARVPFHLFATPYSDEGNTFYRTRLLSLWPIIVVLAGSSIWAWRLDTVARRRARLDLCPKCGYDRAGLAHGSPCPECGASQPVNPPNP